MYLQLIYTNDASLYSFTKIIAGMMFLPAIIIRIVNVYII